MVFSGSEIVALGEDIGLMLRKEGAGHDCSWSAVEQEAELEQEDYNFEASLNERHSETLSQGRERRRKPKDGRLGGRGVEGGQHPSEGQAHKAKTELLCLLATFTRVIHHQDQTPFLSHGQAVSGGRATVWLSVVTLRFSHLKIAHL